MDFYSLPILDCIKKLNSNLFYGLNYNEILLSQKKYGLNQLSKQKKASFFSKIFNVLKEPMILILLFSFSVAFGISLGKFFKSGEMDYTEWLGIFLAILLSVLITLIMEGSSEKAFEKLNSLYESITVKVLRNGLVKVISKKDICVGDIVILESGDKVVADGRLIESESLSVDESPLTGESHSIYKDCNLVLKSSTPLAERKNCVYSGTFIASGKGKMLVTAIGDNTEIGKIARELKKENKDSSPLQQKLTRLGKTITIIGISVAIFVFAFRVIRLIVSGNVTFNGVQELFVSCIVLIVAAVPEGLPTIVALSLALNMIKLAKENALIKKMVATETAGAVSVICSDKTGTLTQNKMELNKLFSNGFCGENLKENINAINENFVINNNAEMLLSNEFIGTGTEKAILQYYIKNNKKNYSEIRKNNKVIFSIPFVSENKYMVSAIKTAFGYRIFIKGAPEKVIPFCRPETISKKTNTEIEKWQEKSFRVLFFAHKDIFFENISEDFNFNNQLNNFTADCFVTLYDPIRKEVYSAVNNCFNAGIKVKMLTGDNITTAFAIAKELKIANSFSQVIEGRFLENMTDSQLESIIPNITVIARSTPIIKLRVVKALKNLGEIVAVTGDGINDAPAIKHADVGIVMGKSGSEITKEAGDIILLDDSFSLVEKCISFGRSVYRNLQRFILFQLSVNLSALLIVMLTAIFGLEAPFNTLQLLFINVIMDGPPALTLGLNSEDKSLMKIKPVKRNKSIVTLKMLLIIVLSGCFSAFFVLLQNKINFLKVNESEKRSAVFTLFILFQLFNAFNCKELGSNSIFNGIGKNKIMLITFLATFMVHIFIVQVAYKIFNLAPMCFVSWVKCFACAFSIIVIFEVYKLIYRLIKNKGFGFGKIKIFTPLKNKVNNF